MAFVTGVLADRRGLGSTARLLHDLCFDRIELAAPSLEYEPRWSCKCPDCAALWIASKAGHVMRIDLQVPAASGTSSTRAPHRMIPGNRAARAIYHVHDSAALGGGSFLLVGRDNGMLDFIEDPPRGEGERRSSFHLDSWSTDDSVGWLDIKDGFARRDNPQAKYENYAKGVTAIAAIAHPREAGTLDILVATRHPRLYVIEARGGRLRLLTPRPLPGWIDWILCPADAAGGWRTDSPPDRRVTLISRGGDIVRLDPDDLLSGAPGQGWQLPLLPTAAMPFDGRGLLLGTTTGLFLVGQDHPEQKPPAAAWEQAIALPVTRSPVLCLDRASLVAPTGRSADSADYVTMGLDDGRLRVIDTRLLHELASGEHSSKPHYNSFVIDLHSAVLTIETLRPRKAVDEAAYVLAGLRDHSVRLFQVTTEHAQRKRFAAQWEERLTGRKPTERPRRVSERLSVELEAAREPPPPGCDRTAWSYALIDVVLHRVVTAALRSANPLRQYALEEVVTLACELAGRADRRGLHRLSIQMWTLWNNDIDPLLRLSSAVLRAVPFGASGDWERFVDSHLRDLNRIARETDEPNRKRLVAWTRYVRKYVMLGHTFASKRIGLRALVELNHRTHKYLDALIYQSRLCQQHHDVLWMHEVGEDVAELHGVACDGRPRVVVLLTIDARIAVFETETGRRLRLRASGAPDRQCPDGDALAPFGLHGRPRTLAAAVVPTASGFRVVLSCVLWIAQYAGRSSWSFEPPPRAQAGVRRDEATPRTRVPGLAVVDIEWSARDGGQLEATVSGVPCTDTVHAVRPLPGLSDQFVVGLGTTAAPIGWLRSGKTGWGLERFEDLDPADGAAPGDPTRALAVALDERTSAYLAVAGSDDGMVRVVSIPRRPDGRAVAVGGWTARRWERVDDAITTIVLGPHRRAPSEHASPAGAPVQEIADKIAFSCYLSTASGDVFALSIVQRASATSAPTGVPFGPYEAQPLWRESLEGPILTAQLWRTPLYRSDTGEPAEILAVVTEKGRLCLYNHTPTTTRGHAGKRVSTTGNYYFRGMRLARITLGDRLRAVTMIDDAGLVAAFPDRTLAAGTVAYLRDTTEREALDALLTVPDPASQFTEPGDDLPLRMVERLDHLFRRSLHDAPFHFDPHNPRERDLRKLELCDLIRFEGGAMSGFALHRKLSLHERWDADELDATQLKERARNYLDQLDPERPEQAALIKIVVKTLCRAHLLRNPCEYNDQLLRDPEQAAARHEQTAAVCDLVAEYVTGKLAYSTTSAARLRITAIKELLRVPVLRHIALDTPSSRRIRLAIASTVDSCLRDDAQLVRLETLRAAWLILRNVSMMVSAPPDDAAKDDPPGKDGRLMRALFPDGLHSIDWLLEQVVGGLKLFPSFTQRSALIGSAWYHICVLLPMFRLFSNHTLALSAHLVAEGLGIEVVDMCVRSLHGRSAAAIRSRINDLYVLPTVEPNNPRAQDEYIARYKRTAEPAPAAPTAGGATRREWYEIDDGELSDELTRLHSELAQMWDVGGKTELEGLRRVTVADDSPFAAIADVVNELVEIGGKLASQHDAPSEVLEQLAELGDRHRAGGASGSSLPGAFRIIVSAIVETWHTVCNPPEPERGMDIDGSHVLDEQVDQDSSGRVFTLLQPANRRAQHVVKVFNRWKVAGAAERFRTVAESTRWIRENTPQSSEARIDSQYVVEITEIVVPRRRRHLAYVMPRYRWSLAAWFRGDVGDDQAPRQDETTVRDEWAPRAASHLGRAIRAAHRLQRHHGDVKPSHILIEMIGERGQLQPVFRLDGFAPEKEPDGAAPRHSRIPDSLADKAEGRDDLARRQWSDIAALSLVLYQLLTGKALRLGSMDDPAEPLRQLDRLIERTPNMSRRPQRLFNLLKRVFDPGEQRALTIDEFLRELELRDVTGPLPTVGRATAPEPPRPPGDAERSETARNGGCDPMKLYERLCNLPESMFQDIVFLARVDSSKISPRTVAQAVRAQDIAELAWQDPDLCRRLADVLDKKPPRSPDTP